MRERERETEEKRDRGRAREIEKETERKTEISSHHAGTVSREEEISCKEDIQADLL